ncbi:MAG: hypothetical protein QF926_12485 [Alphaproteobacteria bacterium]|mgnify:CR=1 FL=1|nr:hypothetical protein [Alphaproteobacteria bacterium]
MDLEPDLPEDLRGVLETAALLEVSEFRVFELAYRDWFGRPGRPEAIEAFFTPYMFHEIVPPWVRHFTRHVHALDNAGRLDPRDFGIFPRRLSAGEAARGRLYVAYVVSGVIAMFLIAQLTVDFLNIKGCLLPPCY